MKQITFFEASWKDDINISDIFKQTVKLIYNKHKNQNVESGERIFINHEEHKNKKNKMQCSDYLFINLNK